MSKKLSFDDKDGIYPADDISEDVDEDTIADRKIPFGKIVKIIDEFETVESDFDDDDDITTLNSLKLR